MFNLRGGTTGAFDANTAMFESLLQAARCFGWHPQGTKPPDWRDKDGKPSEYHKDMHKDWDGGYFTNDYQRVTAEDAKNLTEALDKLTHSVDMLPETVRAYLQTMAIDKERLNEVIHWSGDNLFSQLKEFRDFARGGFCIG